MNNNNQFINVNGTEYRVCSKVKLNESSINQIRDSILLNEAQKANAKYARARSAEKKNQTTRKFCVEVPKDTKTVNINININEAPHQDCVCQQILVRMLNGKEYWL